MIQEIVLAESVTISPNQIKLIGLHKSGFFNATVLPTNVTNSGVEWSSNNPAVATVNPNSGLVTSQGVGTAIITATAIDGSGKYDTAVVTVEADPVPESVTVCPDTLCLRVGDWSLLDPTVCPEDADQTVTWCSSNECVAVVYEDGWVEATGEGNATITATTTGDCPKQASCAVTFCRVPVRSIELSPETYTLYEIDAHAYLCAEICPTNATDKTVKWFSSNKNVAEVNECGVVTAISDGTATITAMSADGRFVDTCTITVDTREKVTVKKDSHSFYIEFNDGKVWRFIGLDLSKRSDNYTTLYPPIFDRENYDSLIVEEQRYLDNIINNFSVEEIAYLYIFDPLGIEYYMRTNACDDMNVESGEFLTFKDTVYEAIFGDSDRRSGRFYFRVVDGEPRYGTYSDSERMNVFSNAEVLFGFHTIYDWDWSAFVKTLLEGIFDCIIEDTPIGEIVEMYQLLFHAGGILGDCSSTAKDYVVEYFSEKVKGDDEESEELVSFVNSSLSWAIKLISIFTDSVEDAFSILYPPEITIYNKVNSHSDFLTVIEGYDGEVTMEDIINKANQN